MAICHLVMTNSLPWKITIFLWENSLFPWPCSIAFCMFTRGYHIARNTGQNMCFAVLIMVKLCKNQSTIGGLFLEKKKHWFHNQLDSWNWITWPHARARSVLCIYKYSIASKSRSDFGVPGMDSTLQNMETNQENKE